MTTQNLDAGERKILNPATWLLYSTALFAIILVPLTTGFLYMIRISALLFNEKNEYSVIAGIILGVILSLIAGYIYSNMARKHVE